MILSIFFVANAIHSKKNNNQALHTIYNLLALIFVAVAAAAIYVSKNISLRPHLATPHAQFGAVVIGIQASIFSLAFLLKGVLGKSVPSFHPLGGRVLFVSILMTAVFGWVQAYQAKDIIALVSFLGCVGYPVYELFFKKSNKVIHSF